MMICGETDPQIHIPSLLMVCLNSQLCAAYLMLLSSCVIGHLDFMFLALVIACIHLFLRFMC